MIAIDTETTGPNLYRGCQPFVVTACSRQGDLHFWEYDVNVKTRQVKYDRKIVRDMVDVLDEHEDWAFHNATFDLKALDIIGEATGISKLRESYMNRRKQVHDTMLMAHIKDSMQKVGLKEQAVMRLGLSDDDEKELAKAVQKYANKAKKLGWYTATVTPTHPSIVGSKATYKCDYWIPGELAKRGKIPDTVNPLKTYALRDVERTMGLAILFQESLEPDAYRVYDWHKGILFPVVRMQGKGFHLNRVELDKAEQDMTKGRDDAIRLLKKKSWPGFNPNSDDDVKKQLFDVLDLPVVKLTKTGNPCADKHAMAAYKNMPLSRSKKLFVRTFAQYKKYMKTLQAIATYNKFAIDDNLYTSLLPTGTKTVRFSSKNPNTQNVGKNKIDYGDEQDVFTLREVFGPKPGTHWYCIDYSQLQIRIFAFAANEKTLIRGFEQGYDAHTFVAQRMFGIEEPDDLQRRVAKAVNFGIIFGAGPAKINGMANNDDAYEMFVAQFPKVHTFLRQCETIARRTGYIKTMGGYPLRVPYKTAYKAANYLIQGTEGELVKEAMMQVDKYLYSTERHMEMVMQIHDELIYEAVNGKKHTKTINHVGQLMEAAGSKYGVLCKVDCKKVTTNWGKGESYVLGA